MKVTKQKFLKMRNEVNLYLTHKHYYLISATYLKFFIPKYYHEWFVIHQLVNKENIINFLKSYKKLPTN